MSDLSIDLMWHGNCLGFQSYPTGMDKQYLQSFYSDMPEVLRDGVFALKVNLRHDKEKGLSSVDYTLLRTGIKDLNGRPNGYFGLTCRLSMFYTDIATLYDVLKSIYWRYISGCIISSDDQYLVADLSSVAHSKAQLLEILNLILVGSCFKSISNIGVKYKGRQVSYNPLEINKKEVQSYAFESASIWLSDSFPIESAKRDLERKDEEISTLKVRLQEEVTNHQQEIETIRLDSKSKTDDALASLKRKHQVDLENSRRDLLNELEEFVQSKRSYKEVHDTSAYRHSKGTADNLSSNNEKTADRLSRSNDGSSSKKPIGSRGNNKIQDIHNFYKENKKPVRAIVRATFIATLLLIGAFLLLSSCSEEQEKSGSIMFDFSSPIASSADNLFEESVEYATGHTDMVEVPYKENMGVKCLSVTMNGAITVNMVLDTGASKSLISLSEARYLYSKGVLTEKDFLYGSFAQVADGRIVPNHVFNLKSVIIGGVLEVRDVEVLVSDNTNAPLLLGNNILDSVSKVEIDNEQQVFRFYLR